MMAAIKRGWMQNATLLKPTVAFERIQAHCLKAGTLTKVSDSDPSCRAPPATALG